ncbi:MAG: nuclear transport factor 2 family protein [Vicinamibacterales bacterium]
MSPWNPAGRLPVAAALVAVLAAPVLAREARPASGDEAAVRAAVERFLDVLGKRDLDAVERLLAPNATIAVVRLRDGAWTTSTQTAAEFLKGLRAQASPTPFREPLTGISVHVEQDQLAFLRADFTVVIDGQVRSHGVDYFTLAKTGGAWTILNVSYTSLPGAP